MGKFCCAGYGESDAFIPFVSIGCVDLEAHVFVFVLRALCVAMIWRVSLGLPIATAVPVSMQVQIITICTTRNLSAFPFKANPFASNLQIHLAFCVNNIRDSCSQKNCRCSSQRFVLSI